VSTNELVMIVGGALAIVMGAVDVSRSQGASFAAWGVVVLGAVFVILAFI
jgi:hypothetical protein